MFKTAAKVFCTHIFSGGRSLLVIIDIKHILWFLLHLVHSIQILLCYLLILFRFIIIHYIKYFIYTDIVVWVIVKVSSINRVRLAFICLKYICILQRCLYSPIQIRVILVLFRNSIFLVVYFKFSILIKHLIRNITIINQIRILNFWGAAWFSWTSLFQSIITICVLKLIISDWLVRWALLLGYIIIFTCYSIFSKTTNIISEIFVIIFLK